jgi:hypothetical protein
MSGARGDDPVYLRLCLQALVEEYEHMIVVNGNGSVRPGGMDFLRGADWVYAEVVDHLTKVLNGTLGDLDLDHSELLAGPFGKEQH